MPTLTEMSKAHLVNVQNQILMLREQKQKLDAEISNLESYLSEGKAELKKLEPISSDVVSDNF
jgi:predicted RNase H-like nuclease (RuvC/YqgF family)